MSHVCSQAATSRYHHHQHQLAYTFYSSRQQTQSWKKVPFSVVVMYLARFPSDIFTFSLSCRLTAERRKNVAKKSELSSQPFFLHSLSFLSVCRMTILCHRRRQKKRRKKVLLLTRHSREKVKLKLKAFTFSERQTKSVSHHHPNTVSVYNTQI